MRISFESGTLLLHCPNETPHVKELQGVRWDDRVHRYRAPAYCYRAIVTELRAAGVTLENQVMRGRLPLAPWGEVALRPYQQAALLAWRRTQQGLVVLPTGSGKTRLACAAMAALRTPSLCLVPTRALLHQWRDELYQHYRGPVGCIGDGERRVEAITVSTFESAYRGMAELGNRFGLLIVDEVHHFGAGVRDEALEMCAAARRLGLTATAPDARPLAKLAGLIGPVVCEIALGELAGRWLAEFELVVLRLRLNPAERQRYRAALATFHAVFDPFRALTRTFVWGDFVKIASRSNEGRAALAAFRLTRRIASYPEQKRQALSALIERHRKNRVLVFTSDNETAYAVAREHLIMPITCDIDRREREQALRAFRTGELRALVSAQVLNEGLDVPDADVAIIVGGTRGEREHVQRVGRLLRPSPGKRAIIYELVTLETHETRSARDRRRALAPAITQ